jgi:hypothetical protein
MKLALVAALQSLKSWKRLGIQPATTSAYGPATTSAYGPARVLSEEEISKIQEQLYQFGIS